MALQGYAARNQQETLRLIFEMGWDDVLSHSEVLLEESRVLDLDLPERASWSAGATHD